VEFTPRDITLLNLSAALWREGSLSHEARLAQIKLASFGVTMTETLIGYAPVISTSDPALSALQKAIDHSQKVRFDYLKPGDTAGSTRIVSPWALVNHEGRWHLYAHEDSSEKAKTFFCAASSQALSASKRRAPSRATMLLPGPSPAWTSCIAPRVPRSRLSRAAMRGVC